MDQRKQASLDESKLLPHSRAFLAEFLQWKPEWKHYCSMEETPQGWLLVVNIPSPVVDSECEIVVFFANGDDDISLGLGSWHCHGDVSFHVSELEFREVTVLEAIKLMVKGDLVGISSIPTDNPFWSLMYYNRWNLENELTDEYSTGTIMIHSWDGTKDRKVTISDLESLNRGH